MSDMNLENITSKLQKVIAEQKSKQSKTNKETTNKNQTIFDKDENKTQSQNISIENIENYSIFDGVVDFSNTKTQEDSTNKQNSKTENKTTSKNDTTTINNSTQNTTKSSSKTANLMKTLIKAMYGQTVKTTSKKNTQANTTAKTTTAKTTTTSNKSTAKNTKTQNKTTTTTTNNNNTKIKTQNTSTNETKTTAETKQAVETKTTIETTPQKETTKNSNENIQNVVNNLKNVIKSKEQTTINTQTTKTDTAPTIETKVIVETTPNVETKPTVETTPIEETRTNHKIKEIDTNNEVLINDGTYIMSEITNSEWNCINNIVKQITDLIPTKILQEFCPKNSDNALSSAFDGLFYFFFNIENLDYMLQDARVTTFSDFNRTEVCIKNNKIQYITMNDEKLVSFEYQDNNKISSIKVGEEQINLSYNDSNQIISLDYSNINNNSKATKHIVFNEVGGIENIDFYNYYKDGNSGIRIIALSVDGNKNITNYNYEYKDPFTGAINTVSLDTDTGIMEVNYEGREYIGWGDVRTKYTDKYVIGTQITSIPADGLHAWFYDDRYYLTDISKWAKRIQYAEIQLYGGKPTNDKIIYDFKYNGNTVSDIICTEICSVEGHTFTFVEHVAPQCGPRVGDTVGVITNPFNEDILEKILNGFTIEEILDESENINTDILPGLNGIVGNNKQSETIPNCWLLSGVNTKYGQPIDIITLNADGSCSVKFDLSNTSITVKDKNGSHEISGIYDYTVDKTVYEGDYYTCKDGTKLLLSTLDDDVKAIEIAYYNMLEKNNIDMSTLVKDNSPSAGLKLVYGNAEEITSSNFLLNDDGSSLYKDVLTRLGYDNALDRLLGNSLLVSTWEEYNNQDRKMIEFENISDIFDNSKAMSANTAFDNLNLSDRMYGYYLDDKETVLKNIGYDRNEVELAIEQCRNSRQFTTDTKDGSSIVTIPAKDGTNAEIYGSHVYSVVDCKDGYVELRNPHDNSKTFEISEVYFKILFNSLGYVEK